jgi:hypothetical protein
VSAPASASVSAPASASGLASGSASASSSKRTYCDESSDDEIPLYTKRKHT